MKWEVKLTSTETKKESVRIVPPPIQEENHAEDATVVSVDEELQNAVCGWRKQTEWDSVCGLRDIVLYVNT
jgi:hypothetical protein